MLAFRETHSWTSVWQRNEDGLVFRVFLNPIWYRLPQGRYGTKWQLFIDAEFQQKGFEEVAEGSKFVVDHFSQFAKRIR